MARLQSQLDRGESVICAPSPHWCTLFDPLGYVAGAAAIFALAALCFLGGEGLAILGFTLLLFFGLPCLFVGVLGLPVRLAQLFSTSYVITNHRILGKFGIFATRVEEAPFNRIIAADVQQQFLHRIFGCGSVIVRNVGGGTYTLFCVRRPYELRKLINDHV